MESGVGSNALELLMQITGCVRFDKDDNISMAGKRRTGLYMMADQLLYPDRICY